MITIDSQQIENLFISPSLCVGYTKFPDEKG